MSSVFVLLPAGVSERARTSCNAFASECVGRVSQNRCAIQCGRRVWESNMMRVIGWAVLGLLLVSVLPAQEALKQISGGPGKPLTPAEAKKLFRLPKGLRIELVASEPQIESPVAMAFDPDG